MSRTPQHKKESLDLLREIVNQLHVETKLDKLVILSRIYHLYLDYKPTYDDIAYCSGITRQRVQQIENKSLKKLQHPKASFKLKSYIKDSTSMEMNSALSTDYSVNLF